jgi:sigma-B regulation protein RsbQ
MASVLNRHNVHELGDGARTLVLGHGLGTDQRIWQLLAPRLARDHRIILLDWVGSGRSDPSAFQSGRYATLRGHAADLRELVRELDTEQAVYVGHSAGGMIGVLAGIAEPTLFERLILIAASPRYIDEPPSYVGGSRPEDVDAVLQLMADNFLGWTSQFAAIAARHPVVERELEQIFRGNQQGHLLEFAEAVLRSDFRTELSQLTVPSLVMASARDDMVPVQVGEYLHQHLARSSYVCLDTTGHLPQMTHPALVEDAIRAYVDASRG